MNLAGDLLKIIEKVELLKKHFFPLTFPAVQVDGHWEYGYGTEYKQKDEPVGLTIEIINQEGRRNIHDRCLDVARNIIDHRKVAVDQMVALCSTYDGIPYQGYFHLNMGDRATVEGLFKSYVDRDANLYGSIASDLERKRLRCCEKLLFAGSFTFEQLMAKNFLDGVAEEQLDYYLNNSMTFN